jgi:hypothetical protein
MPEKFDFLIVGPGFAGTVLAEPIATHRTATRCAMTFSYDQNTSTPIDVRSR